MEAQLATIDRYYNVLKDISAHNIITGKKLKTILTSHNVNRSLYTYMARLGYISNVDTGKYKVNLKNPDPIHARRLHKTANEISIKKRQENMKYRQWLLSVIKANPNKNYKDIANMIMAEYPGKYSEIGNAYRYVRVIMESISSTKPQTEIMYTGELPKGLNYNPQVDVGKQIKPSAFDLLQTDIRVKELRTDLEKLKLAVDLHISREARPKPKRTIGASAKSAWNKFIQSLTIKS